MADDEIAIIRKGALTKALDTSYSSLRRRIASGDFPKPIQIGPRSIGWRLSEVRAWLASRPTAALAPVGKRGTREAAAA